MTDRDTAFAEYFAARSDAMRGTAFLLCGDWHRAEDLTQVAFTKLYVVWDRVSRHEALDGYVRQTLFHAFLDERRLGWWHRVRVTDVPLDGATSDTAPDDRIAMIAALAAVPPRQRAVLILRYWEDLSVGETAALLSCTTGTVKSQAARGLQTLRTHLEDSHARASRNQS
ncbi:SigE family RNA polymerase sigma factor [Dactylosporangium sp. NPDC005555]|uniref:SigE family RNA polymerase sigma factor n=1 Tax=Dactylosporangium sp. NPDC005555 TaxID=3154889 RepID=UPI0033A5D815